jgi:O-antigen ligase
LRLAGATGHRSVALAAGQQAALAAAALGIGAVFALSAFVVGPLVLPAAMAFCALAAVTVARPEVGIAAAFMMVPLANLGLTGNPPWALGAVWSVFLVAVAFLQRRDGLHEQRLPRLSLGLLVYGLIAMVGAFTVADSLRDAQPILRSLLTGLLMFAAIAKTVRTRAHVQWVMAGIATGALLTGSFALWEYFSGASSTVGFLTSSGAVVGRATAGFAQPNQLAGFLIILIPFAIAGVAIGWRLKLLYAVAAVMAVVGVYVSFSRGALIGLALIPLVFLGGRRTLLFAPLVLMVGFLITPGVLAERFGTLTASGSEIASRLDIWKTAGSIWAENPVTGVGPGQFPEAYAQARVPGKEFLPATLFEPPPHAHNLPLHVLAEGGLFAAVALAAILAVAFRTAFELKRSDQRWIRVLGRATLAALAAFLVHNMFDVTLLEGTGIYFWALLGLISALYSISSGRSVQTEQAEPA